MTAVLTEAEVHSGTRPAFKVRDLGLAEFGRNEIRLAEYEMPGLMALRAEYAASQPLR
ncbi:MAG TPA: adenosylhomocysteinase, partial [Gemmatimonadales bacterium]